MNYIMCLANIADLTNTTFSAVQHRATRGTLHILEKKYLESICTE